MSNVLTQIAFNPLVLGELCLAHLAKEEDLLRQILTVLEEMPSLIKSRSPSDHAIFHQHQGEVEFACQEIKSQREHLRKLLAHHLNIPKENAPISALLVFLPPHLRQRVVEKRDQIQELSSQVQRQNQSCTVMIQMFSDFYQSLICDLTGHSPSHCYNSQGILQPFASKPLFKQRG